MPTDENSFKNRLRHFEHKSCNALKMKVFQPLAGRYKARVISKLRFKFAQCSDSFIGLSQKILVALKCEKNNRVVDV